ncbi:MAG: radical SAM protein [Tissierellia bacterium]|nr:radical SAM protein [Tissierellia bacterium]
MHDMIYESRIKTHHMGKKLRSFVERPALLKDVLDSPGDRHQVIYIHIPYCSNICSFCNMNRSLNRPKSYYIDLVIKQLKYYYQTKRFRESTFSSIYFGGGTPSVLSPEDLEKILNALHKYTNLEEDVEITMESSLTDLDFDKFKTVTSAGVNRLSIGIQTFSDRGRQLLNRRGDGKFAYERLDRMRNHGFENLNIDLIYNYLGETEEELKQDLKTIEKLDLAGFSMYSLIIMEESKLGRKYQEFELNDSIKRDKKFFDFVINHTPSYEYLEITKKVRPNRDDYQYIRRRIAGKDTFPLGAGAGGGIGNLALMNPIKIDDYEKTVNNPESIQGMYFKDEYFKYKKAIDTLQLLYYDPSILKDSRIDHRLNELEENGYCFYKNGKYHLTDLGIFWGNNIIDDLWNIVIKN